MADNPALIVRVGANLDDLKSGLSASEAMIVGFSASIGTILGDAIMATIGKLGDLVAALPEIALHGSEVADLADNYNRLTTQAGLLGDQLLGSLRAGTHGTVDDFLLMQRVNKDLAAGLDLSEEQFKSLAEGAFALANVTGVDTVQALDAMNDALIKGKPKALEALVGVIDLKQAEEDYAKSLGGTAKDLTEDAKLYADRKAMLEAVADATKRLGEQTDGLDEIVAQAKTAWTNFLDELGKAIATSPVITAALQAIKQALIDAFGSSAQDLVKQVAAGIDEAAFALIELAKVGVNTAGLLAVEWSAAKKLYGDLAQIIDGDVLVFKSLAGAVAEVGAALHLPGAAESVARINREMDMIMDRMMARGKALQEEDANQGRVNQTTQHYLDVLEGIRGKMETAREAAKGFVGPVQDVAAAHGAAAEGAKQHTAGLVENTEAMKTAAKEAADFAKFMADFQKKTYDEQMALDKAMREERNKQTKERNDTTISALEQIKAAEAKLRDYEHQQALDSTSYQILKIWEVVDAQEAAFNGSEEQRRAYNAAIEGLAEEQTNKLIEEGYKVADASAQAAQTSGAVVTSEYARQQQAFEGFKGVVVAGTGEMSAATTEMARVMNKAMLDASDYIERNQALMQAQRDRGEFFIQGMSASLPAPSTFGTTYPGRAAGGPVESGVPVVVGEAGPELFVPPSSGAIVPNGAAGGTTITNIYITQPLGTPQAIADAVGAAQMQTMRTRGERFRPSGV
jgi:hypothetical protein